MRTRTTHVRRGASPRRGRSIRASERATSRHYPTRRQGRVASRQSLARRHGRAMGRPRPASRNARYGRTHAPQMSIGKVLAAAGVVAVGALVVAALVLGKHLHLGSPARNVSDNVPPAAAQLVYTERTANDAAVTLPAAVQ